MTLPIILRQTAAIFVDAYRELNAKRLFWITVILSAVLMLAFAFVGIEGRHLTFAGMALPDLPIDPQSLYKYLFLTIIVGMWLTFGASILALISVASIFPDFLAGGSVDLYLSRPISRLRLFVTKYLACLGFVALQLLVFAVVAYLVLGLRGGIWRPRVFLAIPILLAFFSYLFAFCVLVGVWTRSTLAALMFTVLAWFVIWGAQQAEIGTFQWYLMVDDEVASKERIIARHDAHIASLSRPVEGATTRTAPIIVESQIAARDATQAEREELLVSLRRADMFHDMAYWLVTFLPKTTATTNLLSTQLLTDDDVQALTELFSGGPREGGPRGGGGGGGPNSTQFAERRDRRERVEIQTQREYRERSLGWILGTSLAFEAVVVGLAAWTFCRRDY
jgi:hypothetical protein